MMKRSAINYTRTNRFKIALAAVTGLFMFLFLLFFQPFGVNNYRADEKITPLLIILLFIFGLIVSLTILALEFIVYPWLFSKSRPQKYVVWVGIEIWVVASTTFMFYNVMGEFHDFYIASYLKHLLEIGTILIISFSGTHFYFKYIQVIKEYENVVSIADNRSLLEDVVMLSGDYKNDQIAVALKNIVSIKSADNYASLNYLEENTIKKYLIRSTLTELEKKLGSDAIIRINRSAIVNLMHLESFKNHSGKLNLKLRATPERFQVSRSNRSKVIERLTKYAH